MLGDHHLSRSLAFPFTEPDHPGNHINNINYQRRASHEDRRMLRQRVTLLYGRRLNVRLSKKNMMKKKRSKHDIIH